MDNRKVSEPEQKKFKYTLFKEDTTDVTKEQKENNPPVTWKPEVYWQFANPEIREIYRKNPIIDWQLSSQASLLFSQGLKPDQFDSKSPSRGQGYVVIIAFVKTSNETVGGIIELVPTCNANDNLPRTTADGKQFTSNGINMLIETKEPLSGWTGGAHKVGIYKLNQSNVLVKQDVDHPPYVYSEVGNSTTEAGGGLFVGSSEVIGQYRANSGNLNTYTFMINPLVKRIYCDQEVKPVENSAFWFTRQMPMEISDSLLKFLLKALPLKENQSREVTADHRQVERTRRTIDHWPSMPLSEKKALLEERLIYFAQLKETKEMKDDKPYSIASLIHESKQQGIELDVNYKDKTGRTALSYYLENKAYGIDFEGPDALKRKQEYLQTLDSDIQALITAKADFFIGDELKKRPLDYDTHGTGFSALCHLLGKTPPLEKSEKKLVSGLLGEYFKTKLNCKSINIKDIDTTTGEPVIFTIIDKYPELMKDIIQFTVALSEKFQILDKNKLNPLERLLLKKTVHEADFTCFTLLKDKKLSVSCKWEDIAPQFRPFVEKLYPNIPKLSSIPQTLFSSQSQGTSGNIDENNVSSANINNNNNNRRTS